ncbi:hypothetical protein DD897_15945, partial [Staphylococcus pseudintermedius]
MISIEPLQKILIDMADPVSTGDAPKPPLNVGRGDDRFDPMEPRSAAPEVCPLYTSDAAADSSPLSSRL